MYKDSVTGGKVQICGSKLKKKKNLGYSKNEID